MQTSTLAFLTCHSQGGDNSGASQPHKHIQFLPLEDEDGPPIEELARAAKIDKDGNYSSLFLLTPVVG